MKRCTYCGREHPDEADFCSLDERPLELIATLPDNPQASSSVPSSKTWPSQVLIPAIAWFIFSLVACALFAIAGSFLFGLLTALWAAVDCSKLRSRGSRVLGIAFKPVVVFAVVAFLFWGLGFVWYLVLRHRVHTAPELTTENDSSPGCETPIKTSSGELRNG